MEFKEFQEAIQKKRTKKKVKVSNSWGVYDAYKHIRKNGWFNIGRPLKEYEFYSIIRGINILLSEEIAKGNNIHLYHGMGELELRKTRRGAYIRKGKLTVTYPVDWNKTLRLWYESEEAKMQKVLIRNETKYVYRVKYNKSKAQYKNQCFYEFDTNRFLKQKLKENISKGKTDTIW